MPDRGAEKRAWYQIFAFYIIFMEIVIFRILSCYFCNKHVVQINPREHLSYLCDVLPLLNMPFFIKLMVVLGMNAVMRECLILSSLFHPAAIAESLGTRVISSLLDDKFTSEYNHTQCTGWHISHVHTHTHTPQEIVENHRVVSKANLHPQFSVSLIWEEWSTGSGCW